MAKTPLIPSKPLENLDIGGIKQGRFFTEGRYGGKMGNRKWGLKGQLSKYKFEGRRGETKNLSKENIDTIYKLISERLKKHQKAQSAIITRKDRIKIMGKGEKLRRTPSAHFTRTDKKDLRKIVKTLEQQSKTAIYHTGNADVGKTAKVRQSKIMDRLLEKNPVPEILGNQNTPTKPNVAYTRPAFAETPLPINHEHNNAPDALLNPFGATPDKNNSYEIYQAPVTKKTEDKIPEDMPGLD